MSAICSRCGSPKGAFGDPCPACGHVPSGEGLLVAWLLSEHHLDRTGLEATAARIREGEEIRPGRAQLDKARRALQSTLGTDPGLDTRQRLGLLLMCFALTPLPAWVMAWWWRRARPRAAVQSLALAVPTTLLFTAIGCYGFTS